MITVLPNMSLGDVLSAKAAPLTLSRRQSLFARGRDALLMGLRLTEGRRGGTILVPASLCAEALYPILQAGFSVRYYKLSDRLQCCLEDIRREMSEDVAGIHIVHYFGFRQPLLEILNFCRVEKLVLIEDCAHCFWDYQVDVPVERNWFRIYSLWKFFAIPDGAVLEISETNERHGLFPVAAPPSPLPWIAKSMVRPFISRKRHESIDELEQPVWPSSMVEPRKISTFGRYLLSRQNFEQVRQRRRHRYKQILASLERCSWARPLYPYLPEDCAPYQFPLLTENANMVARSLMKRGVRTEISVNKPYRNINGILPSAADLTNTNDLYTKVVSLPIHQQLSDSEVEVMCAIIENKL